MTCSAPQGPCRRSGRPGRKEVTLTPLISIARAFWQDQEGQDLVEYSLLMGFVALAAAAIFPNVAASVNTIWKLASQHLSNAATATNSAAS